MRMCIYSFVTQPPPSPPVVHVQYYIRGNSRKVMRGELKPTLLRRGTTPLIYCACADHTCLVMYAHCAVNLGYCHQVVFQSFPHSSGTEAESGHHISCSDFKFTDHFSRLAFIFHLHVPSSQFMFQVHFSRLMPGLHS